MREHEGGHKRLIERMIRGDRVALSRLITIIENMNSASDEILKELAPLKQRSYAIGITGPPGAGKSTLAGRLIPFLRSMGSRVGVIAVDPSSPFTGGALLGDRIRMMEHSLDSGVFIRSFGTRGARGGLSRATSGTLALYGAFGMEYTIIETVGVGQTELDIVRLADTVVVVLVPEAGDSIQALKAGLMEIGDIFVVNKAEREGAERFAVETRNSLSLAKKNKAWETPVILTVANEGTGVEELFKAILNHASFEKSRTSFTERHREEIESELLSILVDSLTKRFNFLKGKREEAAEIIESVQEGVLTPQEGALRLEKIIFKK